MPRRPDWYEEASRGKTVLTIALELHMDHTGASDRLSKKVYDNYRECVREVLRNWKNPTSSFDWGVKRLLRATLAECDGAERERSKE